MSAITPEDRYHFRMDMIAESVGEEVLHRDPVAQAVAKMHASKERFCLSACLADMVKELARGKAEVMGCYARHLEVCAKPITMKVSDLNPRLAALLGFKS